MAAELCLALDDPPSVDAAENLVYELRSCIEYVKANSLFLEHPNEITAITRHADVPLWADLKLHDTPDTVRSSVLALRRRGGIRYVTIHLSGGSAMIKAAVEAGLEEIVGLQTIIIIGVTLLTSISANMLLEELGITETPREFALRLAKLGHSCGVRRFVCSAGEVAFVREALGLKVVLYTPGIRFADAEAGDQKRIATPGEAARNGSDVLVMGKALVEGGAEAAQRALDEIAQAFVDSSV